MSLSVTTTEFNFTLENPRGRAKRLSGFPNCTLRHDPRYPIDLPSDAVLVESVISDTRHSTVYRAKYPLLEGAIDVVVKFAGLGDIVAEASAYDVLEKLQGEDVPKCYGMFYGESGDDHDFAACIVLEYAGEQICRPFPYLPLDEQAKILTKLARLHREGVAPRDIAERNVLHTGDDYRIIDLRVDVHDADYNHECRWKYDFIEQINPSHLEPWQQCEILDENSAQIGFWDKTSRRIRGTTYLRVTDLPPQEVIDQLPVLPPQDMEYWYGQDLLKFYSIVQTKLDRHETLEDIQSKQKAIEQVQEVWGNLHDYPRDPKPDHGKARREAEYRLLMGRYQAQLDRKQALKQALSTQSSSCSIG